MNPPLESLSDSALSEAVAIEVAGWKWTTVYCGVDGSSRPHLTPPNGDLHEIVPSFATSADAVLPLLEKAGYGATGNRSGSTHATSIRVLDENENYHMAQQDWTNGPNSFARSACIALLKAARANKK